MRPRRWRSVAALLNFEVSDSVRTISLRTLVREALKVKRMTRRAAKPQPK